MDEVLLTRHGGVDGGRHEWCHRNVLECRGEPVFVLWPHLGGAPVTPDSVLRNYS